MSHRFRFSLGQLMGLIALSALLTANAILVSRGNFAFLSLMNLGLSCAGLGVLFHNRRISRWIWVWIAGQALPFLPLAGGVLAFVLLRPWPYFVNNTFQAIQTTLGLGSSLLTLLGFAMTLRDIRRRLAISGNAP
jgi:hypothetical protein